MKKGITRNVFLIWKYVIKIPTIQNHINFLNGCYSNYSERNFYKKFLHAKYEGNMVKYVAPSLFCSWFGLIQIQMRCKPKNEDLTEEEKKFYEPLCGADNKKENFGYFNNRLVCLDYP